MVYINKLDNSDNVNNVVMITARFVLLHNGKAFAADCTTTKLRVILNN